MGESHIIKHTGAKRYSGYNFSQLQSGPSASHALVLEDDDYDAAITKELLENFCSKKYTVRRVRILDDAIRQLSNSHFEIILVDMNLPDSAGIETVQKIVQAAPDAPIIVLTGSDEEALAASALHAGAQDYLPKSALNNQALDRIIRYSVCRKSKESDLPSKVYANNKMNLVSKNYIEDRWARAAARSKAAGCKLGVMIADIDDLKTINNNFGFDAGDIVLQDFTAKLSGCVRETDLVARIGSDEVVIVLEAIRRKSEMSATRQMLMDSANGNVSYNGRGVSYTAKVGGVLYDPQKYESLFSVIKRADAELIERDLIRAVIPA